MMSVIFWLKSPLTIVQITWIFFITALLWLCYARITSEEDTIPELKGHGAFASVAAAVPVIEFQDFLKLDFSVQHVSVVTWIMAGLSCYVIFYLFILFSYSIVKIWHYDLERDKKNSGVKEG